MVQDAMAGPLLCDVWGAGQRVRVETAHDTRAVVGRLSPHRPVR